MKPNLHVMVRGNSYEYKVQVQLIVLISCGCDWPPYMAAFISFRGVTLSKPHHDTTPPMARSSKLVGHDAPLTRLITTEETRVQEKDELVILVVACCYEGRYFVHLENNAARWGRNSLKEVRAGASPS